VTLELLGPEHGAAWIGRRFEDRPGRIGLAARVTFQFDDAEVASRRIEEAARKRGEAFAARLR
jgi:hypothetical protein